MQPTEKTYEELIELTNSLKAITNSFKKNIEEMSDNELFSLKNYLDDYSHYLQETLNIKFIGNKKFESKWNKLNE